MKRPGPGIEAHYVEALSRFQRGELLTVFAGVPATGVSTPFTVQQLPFITLVNCPSEPTGACAPFCSVK